MPRRARVGLCKRSLLANALPLLAHATTQHALKHAPPFFEPGSLGLLLLGAFALSLLGWALASPLQSPQLRISTKLEGVLISFFHPLKLSSDEGLPRLAHFREL